jgi:integrase
MAGAVTRTQLPHIHRYRDRHGKMRYYLRRPGSKQIPIAGVYGSPEFMAAYQAAMSGSVERQPIGASRTRPGTVNAAVVGYYTSLAFRSLAPSSQHKRRLILERFREKHGDKGIAGLPQNFIRYMLDQMAPFAARNWLKALRALLDFAVEQGFRADNPTIGLKLPRVKTDGIHCWTEDELAQFERHYAAGTLERRAFALLLHTSQRIGDVVRMGRQHIRDDAIAVRQGKTRTPLLIPITEELREQLDLSNMTFLVSWRGMPFTAAGFSDWFKKRCVKAGLPHSCAHGLRKAFCRRKAEAGWTAHQIMSWSGHKTLKEVERYTKAADQVRLARQAMKRERSIG